MFLSLFLLSLKEVNNCCTNNLMSMKPINDKIEEFFDYMSENCIEDSAFPLTVWDE